MADKAEGETPPAIPGVRTGGEIAAEPTPARGVSRIDADPRLAEISEEVVQSFRLTFTRGAHSATFQFDAEPSDAVKAEYRRQAEDIMDRLEAQKTQELQDRRRPK